MYQFLKNTITAIIPRKILFQQEENLRKCFSVFYSGNAVMCNICNKKLSGFIATRNNDRLCPNCGSLQRNRRLWMLLENEFLVSNSVVLDFSPARSLYRKLIKRKDIQYESTDLSGDFMAQHQWDITQLPSTDSTFDLILCYHVLEHVPEDIQAMRELFRVLKSGGTILIQTPFQEGGIYENELIVTEQDRLMHFGQKDHVRVYSSNGLKERLESCGFTVDVKQFQKEQNNFGLDADEIVLVLTKPINSL